MNKNERVFIVAILALIFVVISVDLVNDALVGVPWWHLLAEGFVAFVAILSAFYLVRGSYRLKHSLQSEQEKSSQLKCEAEKWRITAKRYIEGLSQAIDEQLTSWGLSVSEKEVALLLLKGFSLKEIASIRNTAEKTARTQSIAIYSKTGLNGRSGLAAFFLEDLFSPSEIKPT